MKRIAIAASAILVTFGLVFLAVAVAHRDARDRDPMEDVGEPEYTQIEPKPITVDLESDFPLEAIRSPYTPLHAELESSQPSFVNSVREPANSLRNHVLHDANGKIVSNSLRPSQSSTISDLSQETEKSFSELENTENVASASSSDRSHDLESNFDNADSSKQSIRSEVIPAAYEASTGSASSTATSGSTSLAAPPSLTAPPSMRSVPLLQKNEGAPAKQTAPAAGLAPPPFGAAPSSSSLSSPASTPSSSTPSSLPGFPPPFNSNAAANNTPPKTNTAMPTFGSSAGPTTATNAAADLAKSGMQSLSGPPPNFQTPPSGNSGFGASAATETNSPPSLNQSNLNRKSSGGPLGPAPSNLSSGSATGSLTSAEQTSENNSLNSNSAPTNSSVSRSIPNNPLPSGFPNSSDAGSSNPSNEYAASQRTPSSDSDSPREIRRTPAPSGTSGRTSSGFGYGPSPANNTLPPNTSPNNNSVGGNLPDRNNSFGVSTNTISARLNNDAQSLDSRMLASSAPGIRQLDGAQNPSLQIQKRAPEEVQVGQPATFALVVRNVGNATAYEVAVVDSVPRGTRLSKTSPPAESRADGTLVWSLGEMKAGSERVLTVELIPETEGEIGSVATVNFAAQASVRTVSTQPKLTVKQITDPKVLMGNVLRIKITVANEGTGVARGVALEADVPHGLRHPQGPTLGVALGDLVPGQSRTTTLELNAIEAGPVRNTMRAVASNASPADSVTEIEVVSPELKVTASGPKLRYLERQATYQLSVTNHGTAIAQNVAIYAYLPRGMQFNSAGNHGEYRADQHAVTWELEELGVGATATTELTLLPVEEGDFVIRLQSQADGVRAEPLSKPVRIEGQSELAFSIEDDNDPIETDGETTYAVRLSNIGTRIDQDIQLMVELPAGAKVVQVSAPVAYNVTPTGIQFEAIPQMKAKDQQMFRFSVQLSQEGVSVVRAHVRSKLRPVAIVKEESTQVYRDQ